MGRFHPIVTMLSWKTRLLRPEEIEMILAAIANMHAQPFTLTQVAELLPPEITRDKKKRRSISNLLQALVQIGYLSKPSERKWLKNSQSLSHFLSPLLIELGEVERRVFGQTREERVIRLNPVEQGKMRKNG
ncbi:MAG: hypothetical protein B9J98_05170 [Candidatus Terraquivivens tikiterensis]|uniref:Uncharacterized protein n=1 Tax=Candidatus Terraquivivens tikiterensis TaxID=1980982 RepID=A0A2R7Y2V6_9ARCH|nr:MAG: hypothetical protein B9J98_05170 [Candidatus Terraquivivens tikiterensis]